ncbi:hypothetical protein HDU99_003768 [Rhizoclosmatium hyalinum]|nr:hypothetical protein HDU99_003768 [Rhizoclosmatium hyalinum]
MSAGNTTGARNSRYNTSVINETPEFEAEAQCEPAITPTIKKKALFKSSAYKRQVQELAQIKSDYNPQIIPVSRRYDSAKIKEAVNGVVDNHRHTRSADPNSEYASESIFRSFKIKYDRAVTAERRLKEEKPILESIEDVQNDVFHRLSQKKHMLVQATKNRKKASKFRLTELGRPSIYSVSSSATATGRFSTIDVADVRATTEFQFGGPQKSESYDEYDDFFGSDDSLDFSLGPKIPDPEEEWNTAEGRMLLGLVETRAKVGRRGPLILESLPRPSKKESISRRGSASNAAQEATSKRTRKVSICPVAGNETPNNPVRVQKLFSANTFNSLTEEQESVISRDSQYEGRKSSMKRASSAGGRVKFELDKDFGVVAIPAAISESIHEEFDEEIVLKSPPPSINPVNLIGLDSYESPYQLKCEKWAPLTMSAVDDFRKTIIPTCIKTVPKIDEIASAVEEKIALPKLMRVWVNPVE